MGPALGLRKRLVGEKLAGNGFRKAQLFPRFSASSEPPCSLKKRLGVVAREGVEAPKLSRRFYRPTNTCSSTFVVVRRRSPRIQGGHRSVRQGSPTFVLVRSRSCQIAVRSPRRIYQEQPLGTSCAPAAQNGDPNGFQTVAKKPSRSILYHIFVSGPNLDATHRSPHTHMNKDAPARANATRLRSDPPSADTSGC